MNDPINHPSRWLRACAQVRGNHAWSIIFRFCQESSNIARPTRPRFESEGLRKNQVKTNYLFLNPFTTSPQVNPSCGSLKFHSSTRQSCVGVGTNAVCRHHNLSWHQNIFLSQNLFLRVFGSNHVSLMAFVSRSKANLKDIVCCRIKKTAISE